MEDTKTDKKWLHTVPGIITAIGSLIGAIAGLLVALYSIGMFESKESAQVSKIKEQTRTESTLMVEDTLEGIFDRMEMGLKTADERLFKAQWHPSGYEKNLVGGSGIEGADIFRQGSREGWYIRPHTNEVRGRGYQDKYIITCDVVIWKSGQIDDVIYTGIIRFEDRWAVLGMGENRSDVSKLIYNYP